MDAFRKQASKLRDQVAKQQQVRVYVCLAEIDNEFFFIAIHFSDTHLKLVLYELDLGPSRCGVLFS